MFRLLTLLFKLAIYLGAPLTIVAAALTGGTLAEAQEITVPIWLGYVLGALLGIFIAAAIFGLPLIVLGIRDAVDSLQAQVQQLQLSQGTPPPLPGVMETVVMPVLAERAFERLLGD
jgi:hypothetical protein